MELFFYSDLYFRKLFISFVEINEKTITLDLHPRITDKIERINL